MLVRLGPQVQEVSRGVGPVATVEDVSPQRLATLRAQLGLLAEVEAAEEDFVAAQEDFELALAAAVEAQLLLDGAGERPDQEVGQQVGARLVVEQLLDLLRAGEDVVAVQARQAAYAEPAAHLVEGAVGAAVGVADHHAPVGLAEAECQLAHVVGDAVGVADYRYLLMPVRLSG